MNLAEMAARFSGVRFNPAKDAFFFSCPLCGGVALATARELKCAAGCTADQILCQVSSSAGSGAAVAGPGISGGGLIATAVDGGSRGSFSISPPVNGTTPTLPDIADGSAGAASVAARVATIDEVEHFKGWVYGLAKAAIPEHPEIQGYANGDRELAIMTAVLPEYEKWATREPYGGMTWGQRDNGCQQAIRRALLDAGALGSESTAAAIYEMSTPVEAYSTWAQISTEAREYALDGLIRFGGSAGVSGLMGAGKTTLMLNVVRGWALGEQVLGRESKPSRTLVVASPKEIDNWLETIHHWGLQHKVWVIESTKVQLGGHQKTANWFAWAMRQFECRTFALDTLFDFFGMPANNSGDQNRIVMNEQNALLSVVRSEKYAGIVGGHQPKSEAKTLDPRDAEEAFSGNTGWMAQHRMRISLRRKSKGFTSIITGRGGYGDQGITEEQFLSYNEATRIQTLGGPWSKHLGEAAVGPVVAALTEFGDWASRLDMEKKTGLSKHFILAGLKLGKTRNLVEDNGLSTNKKAYRVVADSELKNSSLYKE